MAADRELRTLWRTPGFARLLWVRVVSLTADGLFQTSLASAVFFNPERATTAAQAAAGFTVLLLPYSLVGPFAGPLLDRWRRTRVLAICNLVRAALVLAVAVLLLVTGPSGPAFFLTALAAVSAGRLHSAAASAALPHVVAVDRLVLANSVWTVSGLAGGTAGTVLGLAVRHIGDAGNGAAGLSALIATVVYVASSSLALTFALDQLGPRRAAGPAPRILVDTVHQLVDGAHYVARRRPAMAALVAVGAHRFLYGLSTIATLLLYRNYFTDAGFLRAGLAGAAQVVAAAALGTLLAAIVTPAITRRWSSRSWIVVLFALAAVVQVALGLPYRMAPLLVAAVLLGAVAQGSRICVESILQAHIADHVRGRVFSFYDALFNATFVAAAAAAALTLPDSGKSYPVLAFIAAGYALTAAGYALASRRQTESHPSALSRESARTESSRRLTRFLGDE
ncbi:MFS transporter [Amycolatopsis palatopharyngis]|uniref:MFS transporter n=1 Tax=Amycolatopsis palatopharyngis TaxID=187982 RepID=UPI000E24EAF2|nr:MFS transporter [Amycolatopsis palatopharyngis]